MVTVNFDETVSIHGQAVVIREKPAISAIVEGHECSSTPPPEFGAFLVSDGRLWASSLSPRKLSEVAFACGANIVRHEYDLVAEHARFHRG